MALNKGKLARAAISTAYGILFASTPMDGLKDRRSYLRYAENSFDTLLYYAERGVGRLLTNEPLWLLINAGLGEILSAEYVVRSIIFFTAFVICYFIIGKIDNKKTLLLCTLILICPAVFRVYLIQIRNGFAISIFLVGFMIRPSLRRYCIWAITPFIHASFFIVLPLFIFARIALKYRVEPYLALTAMLASIAAASFLVLPLAGILGARQAGRYDLGISDVSPASLVMWAGAFVIMASAGKNFVRKHLFEIATISCFVAGYFVLPPMMRPFQSVLILSILAAKDLSGLRYILFISMFGMFTLAQIISRLAQPGFGWASS